MKTKIIILSVCFLFLISYLLPLGCSKRDSLNGKDIFFENILSGYNDLIFVKSTKDNSLYALNYKNGNIKWKFSVSKEESFDFIDTFKNLMILKIRTNLLSALIVLDCIHGDPVWKFDFNKNDREFDIIDALISLKENKLFIITTTDDPNNLKNFVYSIDLITGGMEFKKDLPSLRLVGKSYLFNDLMILRTRDGYNITFSTASGEIAWIQTNLGSIYSYPTEINGILYGTGGYASMNEIFALDPGRKRIFKRINGPWEKENNGLFIFDQLIFYYQRPLLHIYDLITQTRKMCIEFSEEYLFLENLIQKENYILLLFSKNGKMQETKKSIICINKESGEKLLEYAPLKGEIEFIELVKSNSNILLIKSLFKVFDWNRGEILEEEGELIAVNVKNGKILWKRSYSKLEESFSYPFLFKEIVYIVNNDGNLIALDSNNGKLIFRR